METTAEQIKKLEQELAALKEKERVEREETRKKKRKEQKADLERLNKLIAEFNAKYDDTICLRRLDDVFKELFSWM